ncbi:hypothetical protein PQ472_10935 [Lacticaseibacillus pabuli]|uniref:Surface layer protein A domain-containing protein n=1 Tax=Lacticaseibacillus pabuli TaxID=3025672 RepID=A0ABY7WWT0_9LACO|nr:hypothetical protein [Lacticaseibacillus sp. KACC 23028]WDF82390.1 hypothetical protein PQ472_10935 [Lacticaseibacillus sp. KACC 23028]
MKSWKQIVVFTSVAAAMFIGGAAATQSASASEWYQNDQLPNKKVVNNHFYGYGIVRPGARTYKEPYSYKNVPSKVTKTTSASLIYDLDSSNGHLYYNVGPVHARKMTEYFVKNSDVKLLSVGKVHVNFNKHYGIQIWNLKHQPVRTANGKVKKLMGQTNWKVYGTQDYPTGVFKSHIYFYLGGNQYIDGRYVSFKPINAVKHSEMTDMVEENLHNIY